MTILLQLLRAVSGLAALAALAVLLLIVFLHRAAAFAKEGLGVLGYVVSLFTSGFTQGVAPERSGWAVSIPQIFLAILFAGMIVTVFAPAERTLMHCVAAMTAAATVWYIRMMLKDLHLEILCLPALPVWFCYYAASLWARV
jgi:hypothetical protein